MKVIGKTGDYSEGYICEVSHVELQKLMNLYYTRETQLPVLKVGEFFDLAAGFDFSASITDVGRQTTAAINTFNRLVPTLTRYMNFIGALPKDDATASPPAP